ncbi:hypothetical protein O974_27525 [Mycobacterium avium 11-0986]|nr:hypothetical protein O974_27525 [Mycobacterium avium 11-0986]
MAPYLKGIQLFPGNDSSLGNQLSELPEYELTVKSREVV